MKPSFNSKDLPNTTVKEGQPIKFNVNVEGEPPPTIVWELNGKEVKTDKNVTIENVDYLSKFNIAKAERTHSGRYTVKATNTSGTAGADVVVLVQCRW